MREKGGGDLPPVSLVPDFLLWHVVVDVDRGCGRYGYTSRVGEGDVEVATRVRGCLKGL